MSEHVAALGLGLNLTYWWHQSEYAKAFTGAALLTFDRRFNIQYDHLNLCICQTDALLCHWAYQSVTELHEPEYLLQISQNFELNILLDYTAVKIQSDVTLKALKKMTQIIVWCIQKKRNKDQPIEILCAVTGERLRWSKRFVSWLGRQPPSQLSPLSAYSHMRNVNTLE